MSASRPRCRVGRPRHQGPGQRLLPGQRGDRCSMVAAQLSELGELRQRDRHSPLVAERAELLKRRPAVRLDPVHTAQRAGIGSAVQPGHGPHPRVGCRR